jgi:hypothetical protein
MIPLEHAPPDLDPPNVRDEWPVWRVVAEGLGTLAEIERHWWIEDVLDANEAIDVMMFAGRRRGSV